MEKGDCNCNLKADQIKSRYLMLDLKYKREDIILIEKVGSDNFIEVLANAQFLRDQGVEIYEMEKLTSGEKEEIT